MPPPSEPPYWWAEEVEYFLNAINNWNEVGIWQDAEKLFYERNPGEVPKYTAHPKTQAVKNISDWLVAQKQDEKQQEQMASDPNYKEDLKHAKRAAHLDDLADASDSPEEFQSLINDWDEFCESKRN